MASSATIAPEHNQWSPSDAAAQGIAQEYSSQWHILEQLKSSVAVVDPLADISKTPRESVGPGSNSDQQSTVKNDEAETDETKKTEKEWFILPDAPSSGHASDAGSDSALEISDLRNEPSYTHSSGRTTPSSSAKIREPSMEMKKNENDPYQEQWHVLEELKASVKAMQWSSNASDSSLDVSRQATLSRSSSRKDNFAEPPKRSPVTTSNGVSGLVSSFGNTDDESSFHSGMSSQAAVSHTNNAVGSTSLPAQLIQTSTYQDQQSRTAPSSLYQGTATANDVYPGGQNTSSDLSLESENLGFADLPNRPATIGNYGASDAPNTSPFGIAGLPLQPMNIQVTTSQNIISVPSTFSGNGPDVALMSEGSDTLLSKAPMSARERLQPDGRDGPDVLVAPKTVQVVPGLINYPLSNGSSSDNTTGSQASLGNSNLDSSKSSNLSQVGQLLVGDAAQSSPYSTFQTSGSTPVTSGALGMSLHSNNSVGLPVSNVMDNPSLGIGTQLLNGMGTEDSKGIASSSLLSKFSQEQIKGSQASLLPRQHDTNVTDDQTAMTRSTSATPVTNTSWLSGGVSPTSQALIELPTAPSNQGVGSFAQNKIRDAVMQRIEAHTQITDFGSQAPTIPAETSFSWSKPTDISGTYGDLGSRFVGNGQVEPLSAFPARSYHSLPNTPEVFIPTTTQGIATSFDPMEQGDRQTSFNRHTMFSSQVDRQKTHSDIPGSYNSYSLTTVSSVPSSTYTGNLAGEVNGKAATHSQSGQNILSRPSVVLQDPGRSRTQKHDFSRPSGLDHIKSGLLNSEDDEQSPVSKLLGPKFKATQEYLNKLRNERLETSSFRSTGSSDSESRVPLESHREKPFDNGLRQQEYLKEFSPKFSTSSLSDNSYERRIESKQAWSVNTSDGSESRSDRMGEDKDQNIKQQSHFFEQESMDKPKDTSTSNYTRGVHSTSFSPYDKTTQSTTSTDRKSSKDSYLKYPEVNYFPSGRNEDVHGKQDSLSRYETPLSSLQTDEKAWAQDVGHRKRTLYSAESNSLMSSQDEAEDTDDLLSYEAVLEGDIRYIRRLKGGKQETSSKGHFHSSSINSKSSLTPQTTPGQGELSSINGSVERDPLMRIPVSIGSSGSDFPSIEEETRRFHLSLGAGLVSPVVVSENEKAISEEPSDVDDDNDDDNDAQLSSDGIEIQDIEEQDEQEEVLHPSERESFTTESSSASNTYQPYIPIALRKPTSAERDSEVTGNSSSTYGVYDIRNSSGPGSTNRRRKAMGLTPIPGRVSKQVNGVVYVSPESSPMHSSMQEDVSTDEKSSKDDTLTSQSLNKSKSDLEDKRSPSHRNRSQEARRTGSRDRNSSRNSAEDRELHKKKSSRDKDESFRSRSRGSSFEEAQAIDDYIGGRKLVQPGKNRNTKSRSKEDIHSDESPSLKEYSTSTKNADLNQMWERFQESLRSSPRYTRTDSVSSHLSRLSALLSKPLDIAATSSETEFDGERFRKPRSHSYASSSSEVSTESDQLYNEYHKSSSLSRQIKLRKLLETVNVADVPTFPRLRHRDITTTTTTTSSTMSDTSISEAPESRNVSHVTLPRSNRGLRKVSKTPVLVPSSQSRRPTEYDTTRPKCICAIHNAEKPAGPVRTGPVVNDKHLHRPRTLDAAVNVPSPKTPRRVRKKEGFVDVGVQTTRDSDEELYRQNVRTKIKSRKHHKDEIKPEKVNSDKATVTGDSTPKRKERHIASQNSPAQNHVRSIDSSFRSPEGLQNTTQEDSRLENTSKKEKSRSRQHKDRLLASQNSSIAKNSESHHSPSGPSWFYQMTNRHYSHPSRPSTAAVKHSKQSFQTSVVMPDRLRFDEHTSKAFSPPAAAPSTSMQKLSLQEAFCFAKPDFIKRSRARLSRIDYNRTVRETGETKTKGQERVSKMEIPAPKPSLSKPLANPKTEKLHRPKPRQMSKREIKEMNLRLYNNLPEVKAQKAEDRRAAFYKTNRLRAKLYDKRVRENLKKRYAA